MAKKKRPNLADHSSWKTDGAKTVLHEDADGLFKWTLNTTNPEAVSDYSARLDAGVRAVARILARRTAKE